MSNSIAVLLMIVIVVAAALGTLEYFKMVGSSTPLSTNLTTVSSSTFSSPVLNLSSSSSNVSLNSIQISSITSNATGVQNTENMSSTTMSGEAQSILSIDGICISIAAHCGGGTYFIYVRNLGPTNLSSGENVQIYFQDITTPTTSILSCNQQIDVSPASVFSIPSDCVMSGSLPSTFVGDTMVIKVVVADGGTATVSTKVIS